MSLARGFAARKRDMPGLSRKRQQNCVTMPLQQQFSNKTLVSNTVSFNADLLEFAFASILFCSYDGLGETCHSITHSSSDKISQHTVYYVSTLLISDLTMPLCIWRPRSPALRCSLLSRRG